jgi:hypothetical protein
MKFMIFVKSNPSLEKGIEAMSASALKDSMAKMSAFNEELKKAVIMKDCDGLAGRASGCASPANPVTSSTGHLRET